jgi:hypothetical protein
MQAPALTPLHTPTVFGILVCLVLGGQMVGDCGHGSVELVPGSVHSTCGGIG